MQRSNSIAENGAYYSVGIAAAVAAAGAAFFLDPESGGRRRALVRDQLNRTAHQSREFVGKAGRDARQRARGLYEGSASRFREDEVDDDVVEERVRAELGRLTSRPGPIEVTCSEGVIRLGGDILEAEADIVLRGVRRVRGVNAVIDEMRTHFEPGNVPALQGAGLRRPARHFEYLQTNWSPAPRLVAGAGGFGMIAGGVAAQSPAGYALALGGAALFARSVCNKPLSRLFGVQ
ncbi:MAG: BON domain-containing protein [Steroidobacter sp.]